MTLLDWLIRGARFRKHFDTYALTRASLVEGLSVEVNQRIQQRESLVLVTHFKSTFCELESAMRDQDLAYEVLAERVSPDQLITLLSKGPPTVHLTLADMLVDSSARTGMRSFVLSIIVAERHPQLRHDARIERFARKIPGPVRLGYFVSLEDPLIARVVNPTTIEILRQLGLGKNDLISSHMLTRAVTRSSGALDSLVTDPSPAESPEEWFSVNLPSHRPKSAEG